jgi:integrase
MPPTTVKLHKSGDYWQASYYEPSGRRVRKGLGSRAKVSERDALLECARIETEMESRGRIEAKGNASVEYICDDWYADRISELGPETRKSYIRLLCTIKGHFGAKTRASRIAPDQCVDFKNLLLEKCSPSTSAIRFTLARSIFERARKRRLITENPFDMVTRPSANIKVDHTYIPADERFEAMLDDEPNVQYRAYIAIMRYAGLRRNEPLSLKWEHIDFSRRRIIVPGRADGRITTKKRRRELPLDPRLDRHLLGMLVASPDRSTRPFAGCNPTVLRETIRRMVERSKYPVTFTPQSLRVSRENDWMQEHPQAEVAAWLGHSTMTQMRYYHQPLSPASQRTMDAAATTVATKTDGIDGKNIIDADKNPCNQG